MYSNNSIEIANPIVIPWLQQTTAKIRMAGTNEYPWFCLHDICKILGLRSYKVSERLSPEYKRTLMVSESTIPNRDSGIVRHKMIFISESGLYEVVCKSNKPTVKRFQDIVFSEILPCIRKYGCYPKPIKSKEEYINELKWEEQKWSHRLDDSIIRHYSYMSMYEQYGFTIVTALNTYLRIMELNILSHRIIIGRRDLPDGSVSHFWNKERERRGYPEIYRRAPLFVPSAKRPVTVKVYPRSEQFEFMDFFRDVWLPNYCPNYLYKKFRKVCNFKVPLSASDNICRELTGTRPLLPKNILDEIDANGGMIRAEEKYLLPVQETRLLKFNSLD